MANPLDMVTEDQSVQPDDDGLRRVVIRTPGQPAPDLGAPDGYGNNALTQAVQPEAPSELMQGIAALADYLKNGQFSPGTKVGKLLFGSGGQPYDQAGDTEHYQTWPEKMLRSGLTLPGDVMSGDQPMLPPGLRREDFTDQPAPRTIAGQGNVAPTSAFPSDQLYERVQDMAGLAGGGALTERPGVASLGSGPVRPDMRPPSLIPAIKYEGKVYPGHSPGSSHVEIFPDPIAQHMEKHGIEFADEVPGVESGFINERGQYMSRQRAGHYAEDMGLVRPEYKGIARKGGLGSEMLLSDTSQPGAAVSAAAHSGPAPVFYSALEHAATNAAQDTMSAPQWLGYLKNQPGVKKEELDWSGLEGWLGAQKGKVKKEDVQAYLDAHKTEIKDVTKGNNYGEGDDAVGNYIDEHHDRLRTEAEREVRRADPELEHQDPSAHADAIEDTIAQIADDEMRGGVGGGGDVTEYSNYQLPGGENYREHLLTMPPRGRKISQAERDQIDSDFENGHLSDKEYEAKLAGYETDNKNNYNSSHWDEPNVLAHVRTNDRVLEDPGFRVVNTKSNNASQYFKTREEAEAYQAALPENVRAQTKISDKAVNPVKSLHIEEIQSDWHQQGRKQGYKANDKFAVFDKDGNVMTTHPTLETAEKNAERGQGWTAGPWQGKGVPDAPFKTTWPELALKRMIRHAAENGYDRISWTPGEAQAARYDLSRHVEAVRAIKNTGGKWVVSTKRPGAHGDDFTAISQGSVPESELSNLVGKDLADKIVKDGGGEYSGLDLKVGGEGMREFYDKMLPKMAEKIGKSHGVKVKQTELPLLDDMGGGIKKRVKQPVHYFDLPQSLKDHAVGKGFPLYMSGIPFPLTPVDHDPFKKERK